MEYTPTSTSVRDQWNKFIKYLKEKNLSGSKKLDHGPNPTKKLLDQYRAVDPEFTIQPKDIGNIQFEMNQYKQTGEFPGYGPEAQKAIQTAYKKYADTKQFSKQDSWIGSQTSQQFFPTAKTTLAVTNPQGQTKIQSQDYGARMDDFVMGKGINWSEKSKSQGTHTTIVGTEGMDITHIPTPPSIQNQPMEAVQKGIPINGKKVKLGSQLIGTYDNGVFVPAGNLSGNASRIANDPKALNEYLLSNGYSQGETRIAQSFKEGGTKKPVYTQDKSKVQAYKDSLTMYELGEFYRKERDKKRSSIGIGEGALSDIYHRVDQKKKNEAFSRLTALNGTSPVPIGRTEEINVWDNGDIIETNSTGLYKKPVQPYKYGSEPRPQGKSINNLPYSGLEELPQAGQVIPPELLYGEQMVPYTENTRFYPGGPVNWEEKGMRMENKPYKKGGMVKCATGGTPYSGYYDQRTDAPADGTQIPMAPVTNYQEYQQLQNPAQQPEEPKKPSWARRTWNNIGAVSDGVQDLIDVGGAAVNYFDQQNKQKEFDAAQRAKMNTDGLFGPGAMGTSKGDFVQNGSAYGLFQPNKQGNFTGKGMTQGAYYPGFAMGGTLVPEGYNDPGQTFSTAMPSFDRPAQVDVEQIKQEVIPNNTAPAQEVSDLKEFIIAKESSGNYKALPKKKDGTLASSAVGAYQFLWGAHNKWITKVTGVKSKDEFRNNPEAQDKAFDYWNETVLTPEAMKIAALINNPAITLDAIKAQIHFSGVGGARDYYLKGKKTTDAFGTTNDTYASNNPTKKYEIGGEYEMTEKELLKYMKNGGKVEFL